MKKYQPYLRAEDERLIAALQAKYGKRPAIKPDQLGVADSAQAITQFAVGGAIHPLLARLANLYRKGRWSDEATREKDAEVSASLAPAPIGEGDIKPLYRGLNLIGEVISPVIHKGEELAVSPFVEGEEAKAKAIAEIDPFVSLGLLATGLRKGGTAKKGTSAKAKRRFEHPDKAAATEETYAVADKAIPDISLDADLPYKDAVKALTRLYSGARDVVKNSPRFDEIGELYRQLPKEKTESIYESLLKGEDPGIATDPVLAARQEWLKDNNAVIKTIIERHGKDFEPSEFYAHQQYAGEIPPTVSSWEINHAPFKERKLKADNPVHGVYGRTAMPEAETALARAMANLKLSADAAQAGEQIGALSPVTVALEGGNKIPAMQAAQSLRNIKGNIAVGDVADMTEAAKLEALYEDAFKNAGFDPAKLLKKNRLQQAKNLFGSKGNIYDFAMEYVPEAGEMELIGKYGDLGGRFADKDLARYITAHEHLQQRGAVTKGIGNVLNKMKYGQTVLNPSLYIPNAIEGGLRLGYEMPLTAIPGKIAEGAKSLASKDKDYWDALSEGILQSEDLRNTVARNGGQFEPGSIAEKAEGLSKIPAKAYNLSDDVVGMAMYKHLKGQGSKAMSDAAATKMNYGDIPAWVQDARSTVLPFATYPYLAMKNVARWHNPKEVGLGKAAKNSAYTAGLAIGLPTIAERMFNDEDSIEQADQQRDLERAKQKPLDLMEVVYNVKRGKGKGGADVYSVGDVENIHPASTALSLANSLYRAKKPGDVANAIAETATFRDWPGFGRFLKENPYDATPDDYATHKLGGTILRTALPGVKTAEMGWQAGKGLHDAKNNPVEWKDVGARLAGMHPQQVNIDSVIKAEKGGRGKAANELISDAIASVPEEFNQEELESFLDRVNHDQEAMYKEWIKQASELEPVSTKDLKPFTYIPLTSAGMEEYSRDDLEAYTRYYMERERKRLQAWLDMARANSYAKGYGTLK